MKEYLESRGLAPLILNLGTTWRRVVDLTPRPLLPWKRISVRIGYEAGWATELVWTFWRKEKLPVPAGIETPDRPVRRLHIIRLR